MHLSMELLQEGGDGRSRVLDFAASPAGAAAAVATTLA